MSPHRLAAIAKVLVLREVRVDRGSVEAEERMARRAARELIERFGLTEAELVGDIHNDEVPAPVGPASVSTEMLSGLSVCVETEWDYASGGYATAGTRW